MKKVSLLLAGIMAVSMIAGCGSKGEKTSSGSGTTLTVEVFDRGNAGMHEDVLQLKAKR